MNAGPYRGWRIAGSSAVLMAFCATPLLMASFGLFLPSLEREFGWSRAAISGALTAHVLASIVAAPIVGRIVDRIGARSVVVLCFVLLGLTIAAHSVAIVSPMTLWLLYATTAIVGAGCSPVAFTKLISRWFLRRRGLALGIGLCGVGIGAALTPLVVQPIISGAGWRTAYLVLGLGPLLIAAPLAAWLLIEAPRDRDRAGATAEGVTCDGVPPPGVELSAAARTRLFWTIGLIFALVGAGYTGVATHLVPRLTDEGWSLGEASRIQVLIGVSVIVGRLATGALIDRYFAPHVAAGATALLAVGVVLLLNGERWEVVAAGAVLLGLCAGAEIDVMAYLAGRYFGARCFASIFGSLQACYSTGVAVGPLMVGLVRDRTGAYESVAVLVGATLASAIVLLFTLPRYRALPPVASPESGPTPPLFPLRAVALEPKEQR